MSYKLSKRADNDFSKIYKYTVKYFGQQQAEKYGNSLEECFILLGDTPTIGRKAQHIRKELFRHEHENHTIFYRIKKDHIFIIRILHENMNPLKHL